LGVILVLTGFSVQWPTRLSLAIYPVLIWMYVWLTRAEEREARATLGAQSDAYVGHVPALVSELKRTIDAIQ
jgi:protein-S-isoprenylcysteine O-methyltransferase Ste14